MKTVGSITRMQDLSLIICTHNNSQQLSETLAAIAAQRLPADVKIETLVVDNNCTDNTASIVEAFSEAHRFCHVRLVLESRQGLTHARRCGALHSQAEWIAFVDDDCVLEPDWVGQALGFARQNRQCGAIGGRVVLDYETPPPAYLNEFGWLMAQQDFGDRSKRVSWLVGAGLMLRRTALVESGWVEKPLLEDRIGERPVSGGDIEIGLRIAAKNWQLWYVPACRLTHRIGDRRTADPYLRRLAFGLGVSEVMVKGLGWDGGQARFIGTAGRRAAAHSISALKRWLSALPSGRDPRPGLLDASYACGIWAGIAHIICTPAAARSEILGAARCPDV